MTAELFAHRLKFGIEDKRGILDRFYKFPLETTTLTE